MCRKIYFHLIAVLLEWDAERNDPSQQAYTGIKSYLHFNINYSIVVVVVLHKR